MKNIHQQIHDQSQGQNFDCDLKETTVFIQSDKPVFPQVNTENKHQRIAENSNDT